jgi:hypothetical protein
MAVFLKPQVDPLASMKRGFTADRAAVGVVIEQNEKKKGLPP